MNYINVKLAFKSVALLCVSAFFAGCIHTPRPLTQTEKLKQYLESTINTLPGNYKLLQVDYFTVAASVNYYNQQVPGDFLLHNMTHTVISDNMPSIGERADNNIKTLLSVMNKKIKRCEKIHETNDDSLQICDISPTSGSGQFVAKEYVIQWALRIGDKTALNLLHNNTHLENMYTVTEKMFLYFDKPVGTYNQYFSKEDENRIAKVVSEIHSGKSSGYISDKTSQTTTKQSNVIYSSNFLPKNYQERLKKDLYLKLTDPNSAIYEWESYKPYKTNKSSKEVTYCYLVNSKNRYGGYVGWNVYMATFKDGKLDMNTNLSELKAGTSLCNP